LAWNDLHERLGMIFWGAMGGGFRDKPIGVWAVITNDRSKRLMLKAAVAGFTAEEKARRPHAVEEINWILSQAEKLETARNYTVHAPLTAAPSALRKALKLIHAADIEPVMPDEMLLNPRA